jgi:hypothetical protein
MYGADFGRATIIDSDFSGAALTAASFDGALLDGVDFGEADLSAATLKGTVILAADFSRAALKRADLDGAVVFGEDFLTRLAEAALPDSFDPAIYRLDPVELAGLDEIMVVHNHITMEDLAVRMSGKPAFRIVRTEDFGP